MQKKYSKLFSDINYINVKQNKQNNKYSGAYT